MVKYNTTDSELATHLYNSNIKLLGTHVDINTNLDVWSFEGDTQEIAKLTFAWHKANKTRGK